MTLGIDLHTHTTASDGALPPEELVALAALCGIAVLGITDHDTTDGLVPARAAAAREGLTLIPGVEISTHHPAGELHILGYGISSDDQELEALLARSRGSRVERAQRMLGLLASLGMPIGWDRVRALAGEGAVGRPHIAAALQEAGHVRSVQEAFERYLGNGRPAYVPREKIGPCEAIAAIHRAGGVTVLAHPAEHLPVTPELVECGLDGLEAYYTGYSPDVTASIVAMARAHGLICTGGSDFHGATVVPENVLGDVEVPPHCHAQLQAALSQLAAERQRSG